MRRALVVSGVLASLVGCGGGSNDGSETTNRGEVNVVVEAVSSQQITRVHVAAAPANVSQDLTWDAPTGRFTGTLVVPEGQQTLTASAYAGATLIGWASAFVTVVAHDTATVRLTIFPAFSGPAEVVAAISKSEITTTLTALTGLGERTTWSGQQRALAYLKTRLAEQGVPFSSLEFQWNGATWTDLEIAFPGTTTPTEIYMAGAHYDAYPAASPGADDNGSGTAGIIELARVLATTQLKRSVRLVLFFNEESGGVPGSRAYVGMIKARGDDLRGFINLDMIAYRPPDQDFDIVTRPASAALAYAVADAGNRWVGEPPATPIIDESCG